ncbi:MAG: hypothetical protein CMJ20_00510 [Phycisphaeraceae bacterium]|nr:hypothetical protein [Phycisphaeraceae bacterium]
MVRLAFIPSYFFFLVTCAPWLLGHEGGTLESSWDRRRTPAVEVFEQASTSVVNISTTQMIAVRSPFGIDRFFEELFEFPSRRYSRQSVGSGFVLHSAGYVVTNAHVVARTTDRQVIFADQSKYDAKIIAIDPSHDLAILKIEAGKPLQPVHLGVSSDLMVGESVIAIGNALRYQHTVTAGLVSAINRKIEVADNVSFDGLIQTDAPLNPGNSGGPLFNVLGELIGVNTAIRAGAENIGFAIPVDRLRALLPELLDVERRYGFEFGLTVSQHHADDRFQVRVDSVKPGSPADRVGLLKPSIFIDAVDGKPIRHPSDFHVALLGKVSGDQVTLTVRSGNAPQVDVQVHLAVRPRPDGDKLLRNLLGIEATPLTPQMAQDHEIPLLGGLVVQRIEQTSPAAQAQLERGDLLIQIGRHHLEGFDGVGDLLDQVKPGDRVIIRILRIRGRTQYLYDLSLRAR